MSPVLDELRKASDYLTGKLNGRVPVAGIILGSGLGKLADEIENPLIIPYKEIPGFPVSTASGHKGNLIFGELGGKFVVAMQGRIHFYEGYPMEMTTRPVRVMKLMGVRYLFVSNAVGACNPDYKIGDLVIIKDHINLLPNPLIGANIDELGPRFPDMTCAYDAAMRESAKKIAAESGVEVREGILLSSTGPTYETPAEVRFYRTIGADMLGMSTIPEVIVARHCGMTVFGMSVITNISNVNIDDKTLNDGDDVLVQGDKAADKMCGLFTKMIEAL